MRTITVEGEEYCVVDYTPVLIEDDDNAGNTTTVKIVVNEGEHKDAYFYLSDIFMETDEKMTFKLTSDSEEISEGIRNIAIGVMYDIIEKSVTQAKEILDECDSSTESDTN